MNNCPKCGGQKFIFMETTLNEGVFVGKELVSIKLDGTEYVDLAVCRECGAEIEIDDQKPFIGRYTNENFQKHKITELKNELLFTRCAFGIEAILIALSALYIEWMFTR